MRDRGGVPVICVDGARVGAQPPHVHVWQLLQRTHGPMVIYDRALLLSNSGSNLLENVHHQHN